MAYSANRKPNLQGILKQFIKNTRWSDIYQNFMSCESVLYYVNIFTN